jgi:hypothetical protein
MSCVSGTNVVNDGLVFAFDMSNTKKSWKGAPTTNLTTDTPSYAGWQGSYALIDSNTKTFNIETSRSSVDQPSSAWRSWYWDVSSYVGQSVTISGNVEFVSETNASFLDITIGQGNTGSFPSHIAGSAPADKVTISTKPIEKLYMTWSGIINATGVVGFTQWTTNITVSGGNSILRLSNVQIEANNFATPYVNGTRSNTEAIIDLTGENVITASNLSYNSDGTINFDGTDDIITAPVVERSASAVTISAMVKVDTHGNWNRFVNNGWVINGWLLYSSSTGWVFGVANASGAQFNASSLHNSSVDWTHLVGVYDGSFVRLYVNGELKSSTALVTSTMRTIGDIHIGYGNVLGLTEKRIDKVKLYNRALSATEIKQNFEATRSIYGI